MCRVGLVVSISTSHEVGSGFTSRPGHTTDHHENGTHCLPAWYIDTRVRISRAAQLCKKPGKVCRTLYGDKHC